MLARVAVDAEAGRGVALRIEVDDQDPLADRRQRGAEIDRGGRLADPALLIGEREDARASSADGRFSTASLLASRLNIFARESRRGSAMDKSRSTSEPEDRSPAWCGP